MAARLRILLVASEVTPKPFNTRETEATDTLARSATSRMVAALAKGWPSCRADAALGAAMSNRILPAPYRPGPFSKIRR